MEQGGDNLYTREQVRDLHLEEKVLEMWDSEAHGFIIRSLEIEQRDMDSSRVQPKKSVGSSEKAHLIQDAALPSFLGTNQMSPKALWEISEVSFML